MKQHLELFAPDAFDLIIIDEFHHAAANTTSECWIILNLSFYLESPQHLTVMIIKMCMRFVREMLLTGLTFWKRFKVSG